MKLPLPSFCLALCFSALPFTAHAADDTMPMMDHSQMDHGGMAMTGAANPDIYAPAMEKMHKDMMVKPTGDVDGDFVQGMIPHHQGAVDMARIELKNGKDPEIKKFAQDIIDAQEKEIAFMKDWQKKHAK